MTKLSLLSLPLLLLLLLATSLPPAAAAVPVRIVSEGSRQYVQCFGHGVYAANSTYEANRRRLAGLLAEAAARGSSYTDLAVGYWPNRLQAFVFCRRRDVDGSGAASGSSSCAACVAAAFLEAERACPYHREAFVSSGSCSIQISEFRILGNVGPGRIYHGRSLLMQVLASGLIFQAIGFGWLFFLLLQEWRSRKRGSMMHSTPLLSGD